MVDAGGGLTLDGPGILNAFQAWQAARAGQPVSWRLEGDPVEGCALPARDDVLISGYGQDRVDLSAGLLHIAPHLVRPIRMVEPGLPAPGFWGRLFGGRNRNNGRLDPDDPMIAPNFRPMYHGYTLDQAVLVDVSRLVIALARDCVAHGGEIVIRRNASDAGGAGAIPREDAVFRVSAVSDRPWREDIGYLGHVADSRILMLPLPGGYMLTDCSFPEASDDDPRAFLGQVHAEVLVKPPGRQGLRLGSGEGGRTPARQGVAALLPLTPALAVGPEPLLDGRLDGGYGMFANRLAATWSHLDAAYIRTLMSRHGAATPEVLGQVHRDADLGEDFGGGLREREVRWMIDHEWARTAEDVFLRRGPFQYTGTDLSRLQDWMDRHGPVV